MTGLSEFRPTQTIGDGHAMGWRAGAEFTMMEKSVKAEFSAAGGSYPPYGAGNNHNTWYAATLIDSKGKEIPYIDREGVILNDYYDRFRPTKNQNFFMKGGNIEEAKYEYRGPETEEISDKYTLPIYADLTELPELERKVIWGMMVGEEGKTKIPILRDYQSKGFDPSKHVLQCYGTGWKSSSFLPQERQLFGLPGGFFNDWNLQTNLEGLFVAGDALFSSNCYGHAAATGHYAGRHAAEFAKKVGYIDLCEEQVKNARERIYLPLKNDSKSSMHWKELNQGIAKIMQNYCGEFKSETLLKTGRKILNEFKRDLKSNTYASNPHELMRLHEVYNILTNALLIIESSIARKSSSKALSFFRSDFLKFEEEADRKLIIIKQIKNEVMLREMPLDYYGNLEENYNIYNKNYKEGQF